jgi:hypothetical protein
MSVMSATLSKLAVLPPKEFPSKDDPMLDLFVNMLDVRVRSIESHIEHDDYGRTVLNEVKHGIGELKGANGKCPAEPKTWNEAYRLERLIAVIEPPEIVDLELDRRIYEAMDQDLPSIRRLKLDVEDARKEAYDSSRQPPVLKPGGTQILRDALINLLEELHWADQRREIASPIQKAATQRIVGTGLIAFLLVILPYLRIYYLMSYHITFDLSSWSWFALYTVVTTGAFGAFFSRLVYILRNWDRLPIREIESAKSPGALILRGSVGMCGALVVFFFLKSGLIEGNLFPDFKEIGLDFLNYPTSNLPATTSWQVMQVVVPSKSLALLVMWSFLAGFSERLVPSIVSRAEKSFEDATIGSGSGVGKMVT